MGIRPSLEEIDSEFFCLLSWMYFDGIVRSGYHIPELIENLVEPAEETGMFIVPTPHELSWNHNYARMFDMDGDTVFVRPAWKGMIIGDSLITEDILLETYNAYDFRDSLEHDADLLSDSLENRDCIWFYFMYDEGPARQWRRMVSDSSAYDDYIPNIFTQDRDSIYRAAYDSTMYLPTLELVDPTSVLSWLKYEVEDADPTKTLDILFSVMHTIREDSSWADYDNLDPLISSTFSLQATGVRSYLSMEHQGYDSDSLLVPVDNFPDFLLVDVYPFRQVGIQYQSDSSYTPCLGDSLNTWLLDHFSEGLDSTFITVRQMALSQDRDISGYFMPQAFGTVGDSVMWNSEGTELAYGTYPYRVPTPAEFLMTCNLALLREVKAFFPYMLTTYTATGDVEKTSAGLLDRNNIPFDAPYEEWVYRDRQPDDFYFLPPDLFPPFIDSPYDFDPLYDLPSRPIAIPGWERNREEYLLWKFKAYGRLWNSMRGTLRQFATVAPELSTLLWWQGREYDAEIASRDSVNLYVTPEIRVFTDTTESAAYLFYVNRHCRTKELPFEVMVDEDDFPSGVITQLALDHSRRFIIPVEEDDGLYSLLDTLEAGQGRLVEFVDSTLDADIRITDPDIAVLLSESNRKTFDFEFTAGDDIDIIATFFNMGTDSTDDVIVTCTDLTEDTEIDRDTLDFDGLSTAGWVCDSDNGKFTWETDSSDVGIHRLEIHAEPLNGEPDTLDNTAMAVFLIQPRDYATQVRKDAWDMTEDKVGPPDWYTSDVDTLIGWSSTFTDSISGMFEGVISDPNDTNRLYLELDKIKEINPERYHMLSLAGITMVRSLDVYLGWRDDRDSVYVVDTGLDISPDWIETDPLSIGSISGDWGDYDVEEIWFEFRAGSQLATSVRLGWVRLTE